MPKAAAPARKRAATKLAAVPTTTPEDEAPEVDETEAKAWFSDVDESADKVNALFYGREGSTKTTALALMSKNGRTLIVNAEGGVKIGPLLRRGAVKENLKVFPPVGSNIPLTFKNLDKLYRRIKADLMDDPNSWYCIGFDSITEVYQCILDDVQATRVQKILDKGADADPFFTDIADYGTMSKMVRDLLRKFRDLPCNVIFTALERRDIDKDTGKPQYGPAITPGLQADLLGYPDLVLMFKAEDEDGPQRALTRANSRYRAKDRFGVLPKVLVESSGDRIMAYITGDLTPDTDGLQATLPEKVQKSLDRKKSKSDDDDEDLDEAADA